MTFSTDSLEQVVNYKKFLEKDPSQLKRLEKVDYYGRQIFKVRAAFFGKVLETSAWIVYHLAVSVFQSLRALTLGLFFTNRNLRETMIDTWKETGLAFKVLAFAVMGVFSPNAVEHLFAKKQ